RQGVPYSVQISAASPVPSGSFLWGLTGGPAGLALSPSGLLSGTPFQSGFFTVNITAAFPGSLYRASRSFGLKVVSSSPSIFFKTTPCRVMDTRAGSGKTGDFGPPSLPAGGFRFLPVPNSGCGVPSSAVAYSLNVTAVPKGSLGYLSIWPVDDVPVVRTSTLNSLDGAIVANAVIVPAGPPPFNGLVVFASDETDVIIDINGYFGPPDLQGLVFYPVRPCRLADTRAGSGHTGAFGPPSLAAGTTREIPVPDGPCRIPATAQAYALNFTVVPAGPLGYLSAWPAGQPRPLVSTLNSLDGRVVANAAITVAGVSQAISIYASDTTEVVIDVNGYFAPPGAGAALSFYLLSPCRAADTRPGSGFTGAFGAPALVEAATRDFPLTSGVCGIPSSALAFALNVTVVPPGPLFYLSLWPAGHPQPFVSTLNSYLGKIVSNAAIAGAGTNGTVSVFSTNPTELILDVNGFFAP
ncbi:MAG: hypothetical protein SFV51_14715, partial [Bryobacteraceae bacterium]|nr:hypothetical protein [Bryobacteraceae bacterium]